MFLILLLSSLADIFLIWKLSAHHWFFLCLNLSDPHKSCFQSEFVDSSPIFFSFYNCLPLTHIFHFLIEPAHAKRTQLHLIAKIGILALAHFPEHLENLKHCENFSEITGIQQLEKGRRSVILSACTSNTISQNLVSVLLDLLCEPAQIIACV